MVVTFLSRVQESRRRGDFNGGDIVCLVLGLEVFGPVAVQGSRRHGDFNGGDIVALLWPPPGGPALPLSAALRTEP